MITPDGLAARFAPPLTGAAQYVRQLEFTDGAYQLAERALDVLPRGHHLERAVDALEIAAHWVCAGLATAHARAAAATEAEQPGDQAVYVLGPAAPQPAPAASGTGIGEGLDLNVSMWRAGLRGALQLHPLGRLVAYTLAESADEHGYIADADQPTHEELCLATGLDIANVLHAVEELAITGWIGRHNDGTGPTRYQLRLPVPASR